MSPCTFDAKVPSALVRMFVDAVATRYRAWAKRAPIGLAFLEVDANARLPPGPRAIHGPAVAMCHREM